MTSRKPVKSSYTILPLLRKISPYANAFPHIENCNFNSTREFRCLARARRKKTKIFSYNDENYTVSGEKFFRDERIRTSQLCPVCSYPRNYARSLAVAYYRVSLQLCRVAHALRSLFPLIRIEPFISIFIRVYQRSFSPWGASVTSKLIPSYTYAHIFKVLQFSAVCLCAIEWISRLVGMYVAFLLFKSHGFVIFSWGRVSKKSLVFRKKVLIGG